MTRKPATQIIADTMDILATRRDDHVRWAADAQTTRAYGSDEVSRTSEYRWHYGYACAAVDTLRLLGAASDDADSLISAEVIRIRREQNTTRENGLRVGDKVIDFRGEKTGEVISVEAQRGPGRSDKVTVQVVEPKRLAGSIYHNYETVWSKV